MQETPVAQAIIVLADSTSVQEALEVVAVTRRRHIVEMGSHIEQFAGLLGAQR